MRCTEVADRLLPMVGLLAATSVIAVDYEVLGLQVAVATILEFFLFTCFEARWMHGSSLFVVRSPRRSESSNGANGE